MSHQQPKIDTSPQVSDEVRKTTCYMCACRCGINVHMKDGKVAYIEGNRDHPVNRGVLCAKGSAGIMQHNAPSRLRTPMKRVGPRGSGEFEPISWDEAYDIAAGWLEPIRREDPSKLAFFTGRDQSDWERTKLFILFGVAEDHDSNPIKMGIGKMKGLGGRVVGVNPVRSGYNAVADDWFGVT